jgi:hypothetical protein
MELKPIWRTAALEALSSATGSGGGTAPLSRQSPESWRILARNLNMVDLLNAKLSYEWAVSLAYHDTCDPTRRCCV